MISTETLALLQTLDIDLLIEPTTVADGPALNVTLSKQQGAHRAQWAGRAMSADLVDRCIHRGIPMVRERFSFFASRPSTS